MLFCIEAPCAGFPFLALIPHLDSSAASSAAILPGLSSHGLKSE